MVCGLIDVIDSAHRAVCVACVRALVRDCCRNYTLVVVPFDIGRWCIETGDARYSRIRGHDGSRGMRAEIAKNANSGKARLLTPPGSLPAVYCVADTGCIA